ncbi:MAG: hypothetical protein Q9222_006882 [Ikaeria aurantiellina]
MTPGLLASGHLHKQPPHLPFAYPFFSFLKRHLYQTSLIAIIISSLQRIARIMYGHHHAGGGSRRHGGMGHGHGHGGRERHRESRYRQPSYESGSDSLGLSDSDIVGRFDSGSSTDHGLSEDESPLSRAGSYVRERPPGHGGGHGLGQQTPGQQRREGRLATAEGLLGMSGDEMNAAWGQYLEDEARRRGGHPTAEEFYTLPQAEQDAHITRFLDIYSQRRGTEPGVTEPEPRRGHGHGQHGQRGGLEHRGRGGADPRQARDPYAGMSRDPYAGMSRDPRDASMTDLMYNLAQSQAQMQMERSYGHRHGHGHGGRGHGEYEDVYRPWDRMPQTDRDDHAYVMTLHLLE